MPDAISAFKPAPATVSAGGVFFLCLTLLLIAGAFLAPAAPFIVDGGIYADMARAMAEGGRLYIGGNGGVEGAPALTKFLTDPIDGRVYPQYPSGYAILAAPFYAAFGVHGLMLINALSFAGCVALTFGLAERFYGPRIACWAAAIFALATFAPTYAFPIWPHMLSLLFWLGAFCFAVKAADANDRKAGYGYLLAAGAIIGAGINIRIDLFLAAIVLFAWLRAAARPQDRLAPLFLALGLVPGLLLAAWLNGIKFGAFTPFTYNSSGGATQIDRYLPLLAAAGSAMAALWAFNIPETWGRARRTAGVKTIAAALALALCAALLATPLRDILWRIAKGAYVLVINLQAHDAYYQEGVERNQYGHLLFWGYPKKALLQSLPYLPLIALPAYHFLRGKNVSAVALCLLAIAAPVAFYSLNEWHGGGSYNMRYFMPALPFIAILSAAGLAELTDRAGAPSRRTLLAVIVASAGAYLLMQELAHGSERLLSPASLYPQWAVAAVLAISLTYYLRTKAGARFALAASLCALAYAAAINLYEEAGHEKTRAEQLAMSRDASGPIASGSLILTSTPLLLRPAEANGAFVMAASEETAQTAAQAAEAFKKAGRCVYVHNPATRDLLADDRRTAVSPVPVRAPSRRFDGDPRLAFYIFEDQKAGCAF